MNLADAFRTLDHGSLNTIYDNLPFVRTLAQDPGNNQTPLRRRQEVLAEALLLARDSFIQAPHVPKGPNKKERHTDLAHDQDELQDLEEESSEEDSEVDEEEGHDNIQQTYARESATSSIPHIQARTSSTRYHSYNSNVLQAGRPPAITPISSNRNTSVGQTQSGQLSEEQRALMKGTVFMVPPTINPYDPKKDYLPQWVKRTYMYWRWTLKQPIHDIPQRYAVWITLHLNDPSIRYHVEDVSVAADEGKFATSVEVNDYILQRAAGHIKVQEDLARAEFNRLVQRENTSIIAFNSNFLRVFNKVRHFYHPDRLAIQYFDRIVPRLRKRLNVTFYDRYTTSTGAMKSKPFPTLEGLMLAAEQVDDFYRPLPPIPKKQGLFESITQSRLHRKSKGLAINDKESKKEKPRGKLKVQ